MKGGRPVLEKHDTSDVLSIAEFDAGVGGEW
jgi:hypothetical protein